MTENLKKMTSKQVWKREDRVTQEAAQEGYTLRPRMGGLRFFWHALARNPVTLVGLAITSFMIAVALFGSYISPFRYDAILLRDRLQGPNLNHFLGTDQFGRDILSRIIYGAQISLLVGFLSALIATIAGVLLGALAGFYGRWIDELIMRIMDIFLAFPYIVLAVALIAMVGPSVNNLILVIGITRIPQFARLARGSVLSLREVDYVTAAHSLGQREWRILVRHILPNILTPIVVMTSFSIATAILTESALSFLGLGIQPPQASWGTMIADGSRFMFDAPWISTFPGLVTSLTILGYNLFGDGLRDALDPRMRGRV